MQGETTAERALIGSQVYWVLAIHNGSSGSQSRRLGAVMRPALRLSTPT
jgi:hypothetical protein